MQSEGATSVPSSFQLATYRVSAPRVRLRTFWSVLGRPLWLIASRLWNATAFLQRVRGIGRPAAGSQSARLELLAAFNTKWMVSDTLPTTLAGGSTAAANNSRDDLWRNRRRPQHVSSIFRMARKNNPQQQHMDSQVICKDRYRHEATLQPQMGQVGFGGKLSARRRLRLVSCI